MDTTSYDVGNRIDQAELRFLVDKNADGIIVVDTRGIVLFANPAAELLFGRSTGSLIGSPIGIPLLAGETTEITLHRPDGAQIEAEIRVVDTRWDQRPVRLASLRDVSARKVIEERLRHAAKMEAVGQLTAGIAHDFNNLLTVVLGNLENAQRQLTMVEPTRLRALENATRGARRAAALTERLLALARRKPLEPRVLDVNDVASGMSELLHRTLGERIVVQTILDPEPWKIEADPLELEAAILNLAVNARDAMPTGGKLIIETTNVELDPGYAAINPDVKPGRYVLIAVTDSGSGMTTELLKRAFEPFFTTKTDGRGTGLGLSQVYGFVKQSGGHVKLYSEPQIGTTAKMFFPKVLDGHASAQQRTSESRTNSIPRSLKGETILVVEDDEDVRDYTVGTLRELGYIVFEATDARSALDVIGREANIELLFTDVGLPGGIDGRALAEQAQRMRACLKVLMTTAYAGGVLVHEGRLDPEVELLRKPFTSATLATRVRELLDREKHDHQPATRILVVDDEVLLRMLVGDTLAAHGWHIEEAGSFHEATTKIRKAINELAGAIIDLGLPDRPGDGLVAEIRAVRPNMPIILATGYVGDDIRRRFAQDKCLGVVTKPFDPDALTDALTKLGARSPKTQSK
jgi:signal transduction histidine kinase/DNA-binding response OmpR family regulator